MTSSHKQIAKRANWRVFLCLTTGYPTLIEQPSLGSADYKHKKTGAKAPVLQTECDPITGNRHSQ
ncbi:MAG: hypothetical protein ACRCUF_21025, partial [Aeromonas sobria]